MKPNDVVNDKRTGSFFPGRIWKRLPDGRFLVITVGKHITVYEEEHLEVVQYKGKWLYRFPEIRRKYPVFLRMPSLRKLKQLASYYHPDVWKRKRPKDTLPKNTSGLGE